MLVIALVVGACARPGVHSYVDPFDGPTRGFSLVLGFWANAEIEAHEVRGGVALQVAVLANGELGDVALAGTPVEFRIGSETRVLTSFTDATPVSNVDGHQVVTQWHVPMFLTREQAAWFAEAPLAAFRVTIGGRQYTVELRGWDARQIQKNMRTLSTPERAR